MAGFRNEIGKALRNDYSKSCSYKEYWTNNHCLNGFLLDILLYGQPQNSPELGTTQLKLVQCVFTECLCVSSLWP